ncbi:MAG: choice-of-anchor I family protein [Crocosphaera sp.]|nr:choice-of-anchor I family protein [Crocosphaera sp.]
MLVSIASQSIKQFAFTVIPATLFLGVCVPSANALNITRLGSFETGLEAGAEIASYDPITQQLFVTNTANNQIDIISITNPKNPFLVNSINLTSFGGGVNSVAVKNGIVATAIEANTITDPGTVAFFDVTGNPLNSVTVGALPDMLTFTPDGSKVLVANEGEPNEAYTVDPEGSISIIDLSGGIAGLNQSNVSTASFTAFNGQEATLRANGVRIFGVNASGIDASASQDFEPEYIAISPDGETAVVTLQENNAFAVVDIANAVVNHVLPLGFKDHSLPNNGLDASDRDDRINIQNWPILGMYQPDAIASFEVEDEVYYITANEGDARVRPTDDDVLPPPDDEEGIIFNEESRVKDLILDPEAFPNAAELQEDENIGRLNVTNTLGDPDEDGDFDELYAFGTRSFSIWNSNGELVFDSGDDLEQITAALFPDIFNANRDVTPDSFDSRSDNKGPEPEGVTVGVIGNRTYGFIGLERIGGFMVYDITNPLSPQFIAYQNDTALGDLSPEGLLFISPQDSPNNKPLLVLTNEESGNTSIYSVTTPEPSFILGLMMLGIVGTLKNKFSGNHSKVKFYPS